MSAEIRRWKVGHRFDSSAAEELLTGSSSRHIDILSGLRYGFSMSLAQLKDQATHLQEVEQRELIAFLVSLQTEKDESFKSTLAQKIDDTDPAHWLDLDDLQKRYTE